MFKRVYFVVALCLAPLESVANEPGSLLKNVMHGCFLSTNDNLEVSCDAKASAGSRWTLEPANDGQATTLYSAAHDCVLGVSRDRSNDQLACYSPGSERNAHTAFDLKPTGRVFNLVSGPRRCAVYGNRQDIPTCLGLEASQDQQWAVVSPSANPAPAPRVSGFRTLGRETCQPIRTQRDGAPMTATFRVGAGVKGQVELVWADKNGNWQNYGWLSAGQSLEINSFGEHQWVMRLGQQCAYARVTKGDTKFIFE